VDFLSVDSIGGIMETNTIAKQMIAWSSLLQKTADGNRSQYVVWTGSSDAGLFDGLGSETLTGKLRLCAQWT
jgi:hypothetical protein